MEHGARFKFLVGWQLGDRACNDGGGRVAVVVADDAAGSDANSAAAVATAVATATATV
jgi:hypothetical protein